MRIVIDLQGAQSNGSRNRGIGRYTLSLAQAIIRNKGIHEVFIVLNGLFPDTIEPIRVLFKELLPQENIKVWYSIGPICHIDPANNWRRKSAELIRESFIAALSPDILYITSLFEGLTDDAVISIGLLTQNIPTAVTLYDLIPLINRSPYLENPLVEQWYENKLDQIRRSGLLLAISDSSRQEGIDYLGFPLDKSINVGTAADPQFVRISVSREMERSVRERYGLLRPFVMYTGGIDHRKNIEGLIRAFALIPKPLRQNHQLAIVCNVQSDSRFILEDLAQKNGLDVNELVLTGYVPEEDLIALYNLCKTFIFPSWHEGFGLPALEAMSCGAPVIAANTSSLPEVVGREDALFDPYDDKAISEKIQHVLTDDHYRKELIEHGLQQAKKFSWDESAKLAISAFEKFHSENSRIQPNTLSTVRRPKLAYVSPLPAERTGIADYSAELLPELARHYDIDVIVVQDSITDPWIKENCSVRTALWFSNHSHHYDRIVYHFGNSAYHQHMFDLLRRIPGVVVLHDFFLGHVTTHMEGLDNPDYSDFLAKTLYYSHGYRAIRERFHTNNIWDLAWEYPCNKAVLDNAQGIIVHSKNSQRLATQWYGSSMIENWSVIPHLRVPVQRSDRLQARKALGMNSDAFVVSSFGLLGPSKQNQRLLDAWLESPLSKDERCLLVFVGENDSSNYGAVLTATIHNMGMAHKISITGWTEMSNFRQYLAATDVAVQLRTLSRGETSGTALDCMNYGLATIVNANGSMADLPQDAVCMLADEFKIEDLSAALENLWTDVTYRHRLGARAREVIQTLHMPRACADQYFQIIEKYSCETKIKSGENLLVQAIARIESAGHDERELLSIAKKIVQNQNISSEKQLFLDISVLVQCDAKSGIQRVVRSLLLKLLTNPPQGLRVEPVYAKNNQAGYFYARKFTLRFLDCPDLALEDEPVNIFPGDIFLGLDLVHYAVDQQADFYSRLRQIGGKVYFVIYDLLPVLTPEMFPDGVAAVHEKWLSSLAQSDGVICISQAVADEMTEWLNFFGPKRLQPLKLGWFHLGADVAASVPTIGLPNNADDVLKAFSSRPTFLMVGTLEPRKGQDQTQAAFDLMWRQGVDVNLVMVGKRGWNVEKLTDRIHTHPENNRRLFWLDGVSDEYLEKIYSTASCLIAASEGEGFGLPLIEAAQHKLPVIARDIPVFREVLGDHGFYFSGLTSKSLADGVCQWLALDKLGQAPSSDGVSWLNWNQSTKSLLEVVMNDKWYKQWTSDDGLRFMANDRRLGTQVGKLIGRKMVSQGSAGCLIYGPYIPLAAGQYSVVIRGTREAMNTAYAEMDVVIDRGNHVLIESVLGLPDNDDRLIELVISLQTPCTDLEIRVRVTEGCELSISSLEITPFFFSIR